MTRLQAADQNLDLGHREASQCQQQHCHPDSSVLKLAETQTSHRLQPNYRAEQILHEVHISERNITGGRETQCWRRINGRNGETTDTERCAGTGGH
jgi:hypothetical protein